jgi:hypothetical protein
VLEFPPGEDAFHRGRRRDRLRAAARRARFRERHRDGAKFLLITSPLAHDRCFDELAQFSPSTARPTATRSRNCARRYDTEQRANQGMKLG